VLSADRPVILETYADPNVPPSPPHITLKDAKNFTKMIATEPELGNVLSKNVKGYNPLEAHSLSMQTHCRSTFTRTLSLTGKTHTGAFTFFEVSPCCIRPERRQPRKSARDRFEPIDPSRFPFPM
jgi:hypothetical protein